MEIPDYSMWTSEQHMHAAESGLTAAARMSAETLEEIVSMNGEPEELALLGLKQNGVQVYLAEANVHATLAVVKYNRERF